MYTFQRGRRRFCADFFAKKSPLSFRRVNGMTIVLFVGKDIYWFRLSNEANAGGVGFKYPLFY